jgi:hypothetical protein
LAISWIAAFKKIPWTEVMAAAPTVVQGSKTLWDRVRGKGAGGAARDASETQPSPDDVTAAGIDRRIRALEAAVAESKSEAQSSAQLIASLAKQNARVVEAVAMLRVRTRLLLGFCLVLALALLATVLWVHLR